MVQYTVGFFRLFASCLLSKFAFGGAIDLASLREEGYYANTQRQNIMTMNNAYMPVFHHHCVLLIHDK